MNEFVPLVLLGGLQLPSDLNPIILVVDPSAMKDEAPLGIDSGLHQIKFSMTYAALADGVIVNTAMGSFWMKARRPEVVSCPRQVRVLLDASRELPVISGEDFITPRVQRVIDDLRALKPETGERK